VLLAKSSTLLFHMHGELQSMSISDRHITSQDRRPCQTTSRDPRWKDAVDVVHISEQWRAMLDHAAVAPATTAALHARLPVSAPMSRASRTTRTRPLSFNADWCPCVRESIRTPDCVHNRSSFVQNSVRVAQDRKTQVCPCWWSGLVSHGWQNQALKTTLGRTPLWLTECTKVSSKINTSPSFHVATSAPTRR